MQISMYGFGAFNCALAIYFERKGYEVIFWDIDENIVNTVNKTHKHPYHFTDVELKAKGTTSKAEIFDNENIILGISAQYVRDNAKKFSRYYHNNIITIVSKGLEIHSFKRLSQVLKEEIGEFKFAVFSGGTTAKDIVEGQNLSASIASKDQKVLEKVTEIFKSDKLKICKTKDVIGVELSGALKNIVSIGVGICKGLGCGKGTKATLITKTATEIRKIAKFMGAQNETFETYSACFWGDMILSSFEETRNKQFGERIVKELIEKVLEEMKKENKTVEGYPTTKATYEYAKENKIETECIKKIYQILYEKAEPETIKEVI